MTITDLITELNTLKQLYGNIEVFTNPLIENDYVMTSPKLLLEQLDDGTTYLIVGDIWDQNLED